MGYARDLSNGYLVRKGWDVGEGGIITIATGWLGRGEIAVFLTGWGSNGSFSIEYALFIAHICISLELWKYYFIIFIMLNRQYVIPYPSTR